MFGRPEGFVWQPEAETKNNKKIVVGVVIGIIISGKASILVSYDSKLT